MASPVLALARAAVRRPPFIFAAAIFFLACAFTAVPILRQPGWELATVLGLALAFLGGLPSRAVVEAARDSGRAHSFREVAGASLVLTFALPALPILVALIASLLTTPCNPLAGFPFVAIIVPTAAFLAGAVGLLCALNTWTGRGFLALYLMLVLASAIATAWPVVAGPQIYAFNLFAGWFPGPLYDESLHVTSALLFARLETVLVGGVALCVAGAGYQSAHVRLGQPVGAARLAAAGFLVCVLAIRIFAADLGLETTTADLDAMLGGVRATQHFHIHYPRERSAREIDQLARDLEFKYAQDAAFLGVQAQATVDAYFYRSPEEKQRWVGAAETDFAKPWLNQFHVQLAGFPDPVAKHELAHVMAASLGSGPFQVTTWADLLPNPAIIEGLATAADNRTDELTLAEWAHAMRELKLAPDLRQLLGPTGFFGAAPARAYTLAGAFLRYLDETYGSAKVGKLYAHGNFQAAFGKDLDTLVTEWEHANDQVPLDAHARAVAAQRFAQGSIFTRACAREEARLHDELAQVPLAEPQRADELTRRLLAIDPDDIDVLHGLAERQHELGMRAAEKQTLEMLIASKASGPAQQAAARQMLGSLFAEAGQLDAARAEFRQVLSLQPDAASQRAAEIHLASFDAPGTVPGVLRYFAHPTREDALLDLRELIDAQPTFEPARYLLGRRLTDAQLVTHALEYLMTTADLSNLPATHDEALQLRAKDEMLAHDCEPIANDEKLLLHATPAAVAKLRDWKARCEFERAQGWNVLPEP